METYRKRVGGRIRAARVSAQFTQDRFAERLGTSRRHVMRWESGRNLPGPEYRAAIVAVTGTDPFADEGERDDEDEDMAAATLERAIEVMVRRAMRKVA